MREAGATGAGEMPFVVLAAVAAVVVAALLAVCAQKSSKSSDKQTLPYSTTTGTSGLTGSRYSPPGAGPPMPYSPIPPGMPGAQYGHQPPIYGHEPEPGTAWSEDM